MTTTQLDVPAHLVTDFDVYDPALAGAHDVFNKVIGKLAAVGPVRYSTAHGGHWIVLGYPEVHEVLRDAGLFSSYPSNLVNAASGRFIPAEIDPPEHTAWRKLLQPLFNPTRMKALEHQITDTVARLVDGFAERGSVEFVSEFAHQLPAAVFMSLMGWPMADVGLFSECTDTVVFGKPGANKRENALARQEAAQRMYSYFLQVLADCRARGDLDDVTTSILATPLHGADGPPQPTDDEFCRLLFLLAIGGLHTVQGSLAWSVMHLAQRPEQRRRLLDDPGLLPGVVEEVLRYETAVSTCRTATADARLGDVTIRAGDRLLVMLAAANRDAREFDTPESLHPDRAPNRHLAFGAGPHRCVGSHLARIEISLALQEIHRRIPDYRLDPDQPVLTHASQVRGVLRLPLIFTPERTA